MFAVSTPLAPIVYKDCLCVSLQENGLLALKGNPEKIAGKDQVLFDWCTNQQNFVHPLLHQE